MVLVVSVAPSQPKTCLLIQRFLGIGSSFMPNLELIELAREIENLRRHERLRIITFFVSVVSTLVGGLLAFSTLFNLSAISNIFERFGNLSTPLKVGISALLGSFIAVLVQRSLYHKTMNIKVAELERIQELVRRERDEKLKVKE